METDSAVGTELLMFYNVENLFPADAAPAFRNAPTASGLRNWNSWRFNKKITGIARVFSLAEAAHGVLPMLVGLSEIQGKAPVKALAELPPLQSRYGVVHYESMDERGVDVALLYDKSKMELVSSEPITFLFANDAAAPENYDTTRDVLYCTLKYSDRTIHAFVLHLPSKRDRDVNKPKRTYILNEIRKRVMKLRASGEPVVLLGDFNENPDDADLAALRGGGVSEELLRNPFGEIFSGGGYSTFHYADGLLFDQILLSGEFFSRDFPLQFSGAEIFRPEDISSRAKGFAGRPFRTYAWTRYLGGFSDHFPVLVKLSKPIQN